MNVAEELRMVLQQLNESRGVLAQSETSVPHVGEIGEAWGRGDSPSVTSDEAEVCSRLGINGGTLADVSEDTSCRGGTLQGATCTPIFVDYTRLSVDHEESSTSVTDTKDTCSQTEFETSDSKGYHSEVESRLLEEVRSLREEVQRLRSQVNDLLNRQAQVDSNVGTCSNPTRTQQPLKVNREEAKESESKEPSSNDEAATLNMSNLTAVVNEVVKQTLKELGSSAVPSNRKVKSPSEWTTGFSKKKKKPKAEDSPVKGSLDRRKGTCPDVRQSRRTDTCLKQAKKGWSGQFLKHLRRDCPAWKGQGRGRGVRSTGTPSVKKSRQALCWCCQRRGHIRYQCPQFMSKDKDKPLDGRGPRKEDPPSKSPKLRGRSGKDPQVQTPDTNVCMKVTDDCTKSEADEKVVEANSSPPHENKQRTPASEASKGEVEEDDIPVDEKTEGEVVTPTDTCDESPAGDRVSVSEVRSPTGDLTCNRVSASEVRSPVGDPTCKRADVTMISRCRESRKPVREIRTVRSKTRAK